MQSNPSGLRNKIGAWREGFIESMQRIYFKYDVDVPGVVTSIASICMVFIALTFVFSVRNG